MPHYVRSADDRSNVDPRDDHWLAYRLQDMMLPQIQRIIRMFQRGSGSWEGWLQFELLFSLSGLTESAASIARQMNLFDTASVDFFGETYNSTPDMPLQRVITVEVDGERDESHYVELKCRKRNESNDTFVGRVKEGIDRVRGTEWSTRRTTESALSAWMVAVTIGRVGEIDGLMNAAAEEKGIQWHEVLVARFEDDDCEVKIWCHEKRCRGSEAELLFGYTSQHSLQNYSQGGDAQAP